MMLDVVTPCFVALPDVLMHLIKFFDDTVVVHVGMPVGHRNLSGQHFEGRRFARSVDSQQTETLALFHPDARASHRSKILSESPSVDLQIEAIDDADILRVQIYFDQIDHS